MITKFLLIVELGTITIRLSPVRMRVLRRPISTTSPHVFSPWISMRSPIRKGWSITSMTPLTIFESVSWAASETASPPIPRVASKAVMLTPKRSKISRELTSKTIICPVR